MLNLTIKKVKSSTPFRKTTNPTPYLNPTPYWATHSCRVNRGERPHAGGISLLLIETYTIERWLTKVNGKNTLRFKPFSLIYCFRKFGWIKVHDTQFSALCRIFAGILTFNSAKLNVPE